MHVTLTFDNGPDPHGTPAVLDALGMRGIPAVFFVVGEKVASHPELVARTSAAGHPIGNHTWSHSMPFGESSHVGFARDEIVRTQDAISVYVSAPPLFRPVGAAPGAIIDHRLLNEEALQTLVDGGYTMALWNVVPHDWERPHSWIGNALEGCREAEHAVVVLHDGYPAGIELLPAFIDALLDEGADFSTDFPASCTPIRAGVPDSAAAALVAAPDHPAAPRAAKISTNVKEQL